MRFLRHPSVIVVGLGGFALGALAMILYLKGDRAQQALDSGVAAFSQGRTEEAQALYQEALRQDPESVAARYNLGVSAHQKGNLVEAAWYYREALKRRPDFAPALYNFAILLEARGHPELAESGYRRALESNPRHLQARVNLGFLLAEDLNRREEGREQFREAIAQDPGVRSRIPADLRP